MRMQEDPRFELAAALLPRRLRREALAMPEHVKARTEELRLRSQRPLTLVTPEGELAATPAGDGAVTPEELAQMIASLTEYSRYASLDSLRRGYLTVRGGFRVGVCGTAAVKDGAVQDIRDVSGVNVRIVREKKGIADGLVPELFADGRVQSTLILSPPGGGKTTLLRDLIRALSDGAEGRAALRVSVVDERSELAASYRGCVQLSLGAHTDVLDGCPKAPGIEMVLRAMNPQVIALDELASREDIAAAGVAAHCGAALLASVHARDIDELRARPLYRDVLAGGIFTRAVVIEREGDGRRYRVESL